MKKYNFDVLPNRKNTNCVKYDAHETTLPMWVADMDFPVAPKIKEAIEKDLSVGAIGYSLIPDDFFNAFVDLYKRRYNTSFTIDEMAYVSGVVAAIDSILKLYSKPGDNIVMLSPIYHTFYSCIKNYGLNVLTSKMLNTDGKYSVDFVDLEKKLSQEKTKIMILCNPHNPVGKIFLKEELEQIDNLCQKHGVLIISDEIHGLITNPDKKYIPFCNITKNDNYVMCLATSKAYNLAGLQSAVIITKNKKLKEELQSAFYKDDIGEPNFFAVNANIAALRDSEDWLNKMNEYVYQNKVLFKQELDKLDLGISVAVNDATYMLWVDISNISKDSAFFTKDLNEKTGLLVCPGIQFGDGGEGYFRINLATSRANVLLAVNKLKEYIKGK